MNKYVSLVLTLVLCLVALAMSAIGIQFYNKCKSIQDDDTMKHDRNFLIATLVASMLIGGFVTYRTFRKTSNKFNNV